MVSELLFSEERHIGLITLQRVAALNALTLPMIKALYEKLGEWEEEDKIHAVVIQALPGKAFCAGGDVRWLYDMRGQVQTQLEFFWHEYRLNHLIHSFKKPYISLMDGITMGGGVGISLHGSHPIASERFIFAMPETSIGFFPDIGASYLLSRCPHASGTYLGLSGNRLNALEAKTLGLVKQVIESKNLSKLLNHLVESDLSVDAKARVDEVLRQFSSGHSHAFDFSEQIEDAFQHETVEEILTTLERGGSSWHQNTLSILQQKAPLSLKVTREQLKRASNLSFASCIKMDYCLVNHFMQGHDFYEGIRALLVDKDKTPKWQPQQLSLVTQEHVANYFECEGSELMLAD